jgi:hypothetical protein
MYWLLIFLYGQLVLVIMNLEFLVIMLHKVNRIHQLALFSKPTAIIFITN